MTAEGNRSSWMWSGTAVVLLGWGVFSLGATRPWGYLPLIAGMATFGAATVMTPDRSGAIGRELGLSLAVVCLAISLQLVPVPADLLRIVSPTSAAIAESEGAVRGASLSIDSRATALGLAFVIALGLFFVGTVRTMGPDGARRLATGLVVLGTLVALIGIIEARFVGAVVFAAAGLPLPPDSTPYGPFSSKNHYAGWMLMALPLTMGHLCALAASRRRRIVRIAFVGCAAAAMAVALVQTASRAGILCLALGGLALAGFALRRYGLARKGILAASALVLLPVTAVTASGLESIAGRFGVDSWSTAHGRLPIWRQAAAIARDFPLTGSGFNSYQAVVPLYPSAELDEPYEAAHNDFLQLAAEGGLLVGLPALAVVGFFVGETRQRFLESSTDEVTGWLRAGAVVGLSLIAIQETVDFSLQVPANAALFVVLAAIAVHRTPAEPSPGMTRPIVEEVGMNSHGK
jgi:O-antigen ligase